MRHRYRMQGRLGIVMVLLLVLLGMPSGLIADVPGKFRSHPPMRDLPEPSKRPAASGPIYYVDQARGNDDYDGSKSKPWKTIAHAVKKLQPGDTLYLRGGTYYEPITLTLSGTAQKPITIRSHPRELAILDAGHREFAESPSTAWEPVNDSPGEFRSTKTYAGVDGIVLGNFIDSMVPLHGYRNKVDLLTTNEFWTIKNKMEAESGIYCGPGLWADVKTGHIHARLAHQTLKNLGNDVYRGETDPRKLPLVVCGTNTAIRIEGSAHLRLQDMAVRGSRSSTISITKSEGIEIDGLTAYGGSHVLFVKETRGLRLLNSALRSIAAPWSGRGHLKYRGSPAYVLSFREGCSDFEVANCEFTDGHDGPFIGAAKGMKFHHNLVDNFNDDGVYLTAMGVGGDIEIYQNRLSRCLHVFAFYGGHQPGSGVHIYRNVIDMRRPVFYAWPPSADDPLFVSKATGQPAFPPAGWLCGDHGSPIWEPMWFYQNTVISQTHGEARGYYAAGMAGHTARTQRRVFNNIFVEVDEIPAQNFFAVEADHDFQADANLLWGVKEGPSVKDDPFAAFRKAEKFTASKKQYPPGWGANDVFADPRFVQFPENGKATIDLRLQNGSPAINAGVAVPAEWPDPLRKSDNGKLDLGALPLGSKPWSVGVNGRYSMFGEKLP